MDFGPLNVLTKLPDAATGLASVFVGGGGGGAVARSFGNAVFDEVVVDSQFFPEQSIQPFAPGAADSPAGSPGEPVGGWLAKFVRPRVRLRKNGETVATFAPAGEPEGSPLPGFVGLVATGVTLVSMVIGARRLRNLAALTAAGGFFLAYQQQTRRSA